MRTLRRSPKRYASILLSLVLVTGLLPANAAFAQEANAPSWSEDIPALLEAGPYEEGSVIACVDKAAADRYGIQSFMNDVMGRADAADGSEVLAVQAEAVADSVEPGTTLLSASQDTQYAMVTVSDSAKSTQQLLNELAADPAVLFAEPNYIMTQTDADSDVEALAAAAVDAASQAENTVAEDTDPQDAADASQAIDQSVAEAQQSDELLQLTSTEEGINLAAANTFSTATFDGKTDSSSPLSTGSLTDQQYAVNNTTTFKTLGAQAGQASINASGWNSPDGNMDREVVVAVLDSGIDYHNPDLANRLVTFTPAQQEQLDCAQYGYNAVTGESTRDVSGYGEHGTHCAGIIGAEWNDFGVSGVGSKVRVLNVRVMGSDGRTSVSSILAAYAFLADAVDAGIPVEVTSNSFGIYQCSRALNAATYQLGSKHNVTSVFAAGNDSLNLDVSNRIASTLSANPYVLLVGASDSDNAFAAYSDWGVGTVDLAAPGTGIYSTVPLSGASYIPDADAAADRLFYAGYENGDDAVGFRQVNPYTLEGRDTQFSISSDASIQGDQSGKAVLDSSWFSYYGYNMYALRSNPISVTRPAAGQTAYCAVNVYACANANLFLGAVDGQLNSGYAYAVRTTDGTFTRVASALSGNAICRYGTWQTLSFALPQNTDYDHFQIMVGFILTDADPTLEVYIDSLGVGTHVSPYQLDTGTSMAAPLAAGAVAVQSSCYAADSAQNDAAERVKRLSASVRSNATCQGKVSAGGILDLSVTASQQPSEKSLSPVITNVDVQGSAVAIYGANFGAKEGQAAASVCQYGLAAKGADLPFVVSSWTDECVSLKLAADPSGILNVALTNAGGKSFETLAFAKLSDKVYENRLAVPDLTVTANNGVFDDFASSEARGCMVGLQNKLYYLPLQTQIEAVPFTQRMWVYDIASNTWQEGPALPQPLEGASMVIYEGMLVVEGATMDIIGGAPMTSSNKTEVVYTLDPYAGQWTKANTDGLPVGATLASMDGKILAVGGTASAVAEVNTSTQVVSFDPTTGAGDLFATMIVGYTDPQVAAYGSSLVVYSDGGTSPSAIAQGLLVSEDASSVLAMPELLPMAATDCAFATVADGMMMVGPASKDGQADTFMLAAATEGTTASTESVATLAAVGDSDEFTQFSKVVSDGYTVSPAACAYDGQLYVMASSNVEPAPRLFRSTEVSTLDDPNDISLAPDPEPASQPTPNSGNNGGTDNAGAASGTTTTSDFLGLLVPIALVVVVVAAGVLVFVAVRRSRGKKEPKHRR